MNISGGIDGDHDFNYYYYYSDYDYNDSDDDSGDYYDDKMLKASISKIIKMIMISRIIPIFGLDNNFNSPISLCVIGSKNEIV